MEAVSTPKNPNIQKPYLILQTVLSGKEIFFSNEQHVQNLRSEFVSDSSEVTHFRSHILSSASVEYVVFKRVHTPWKI